MGQRFFRADALAASIATNSAIRIAIVGLNGKGKSHVEDFMAHKGARIVALCDVDRTILAGEADRLKKANIPVRTYTDIRKLLEARDIDAVVLAVPHHWHVLMTVWACQAGKDVYIEKPATHSLWEGALSENPDFIDETCGAETGT